ncbi:MAG: HAD-IA family hydrolase [Clostridia bacterium]|nr:HAD-IA family hydrolase [Clostridia bacterium]
MNNKLIIFDCFGVIFDEVAPVFLRRHLSADTVDEIKEKLFVPADMGEITYDELLINMEREIGIPKEQFLPEWEALFRIKDDTVNAIRALHKENDIALLSNAPTGVVEGLIEKYDLHDLFDKTVISCNIHMAKPDIEIYRYCVSLFNREYDEIYMIDDNLKNLEQLPSLGITPIHFENVEKMMKKLKADA